MRIEPRTTVDGLMAKVISKETPREFTNFRGSGGVCDTIVEDSTGKVKLTLWNDQIDRVKMGDTILLEKGWVKEFRGEVCISTGRMGTLKVLSKRKEDKSKKEKDNKEDTKKEKKEDKDKISSSKDSWADGLISKRYAQRDPTVISQRNIDPLWGIHDGK